MEERPYLSISKIRHNEGEGEIPSDPSMQSAMSRRKKKNAYSMKRCV